MAGMSNWYEEQMVKHALGITTSVLPTEMWLALYTGDPTDEGLHVNEIPNTDTYARINIFSILTTFANGGVANDSDILFNTATIDWGYITHVGLLDTSVHGTGNFYYSQELVDAITIYAGDPVKFRAGKLFVSMD